jgi:hypothetical protein
MRTDEQYLNAMRQVGDAEADAVITEVFQSRQERALYGYLPLSREDVKKNGTNTNVQSFLLARTQFPPWYDANRLLSGQRFFRKYALDVMTLLGAMSLPYCYAATPGNKAIYLTEKMRKSPGKRLLDTAHFIIEVMKENCFETNGDGHFEVQKTRLIHALVRYHIQSKTAWDPRWGTPVNQEDMAGTNIAFSYIILVGMQLSKFTISEEEKDSFLFAWRVIGHFLRIDPELLPSTITEAAALEQAIKRRHFKKSDEGILLTNDLIQHYKESFPLMAGYFVDSQIRYFVGPEVADYLGLKKHPIKDGFVRGLNCIREGINKLFVNPYSYSIMIRNHYKLKERYTA